MKKFTATFLLALSAGVAAAQTTNRVWHQFTNEVDGDFISVGSTSLVIKHAGTNYFIGLMALNDDERRIVAEIKADQKQARLEAEVKEMQQAGMIELSAKLIENFPEKVLPYQKGWMDVSFNEISQFGVEVPEIEIGLSVTDQKGDYFHRATISKNLNRPEPNTPDIPNPLAATAMNLKRGDKVRLIGHCYPQFSDSLHETAGTPDKAGFLVEKIEMIQSVAEKEAEEK